MKNGASTFSSHGCVVIVTIYKHEKRFFSVFRYVMFMEANKSESIYRNICYVKWYLHNALFFGFVF